MRKKWNCYCMQIKLNSDRATALCTSPNKLQITGMHIMFLLGVTVCTIAHIVRSRGKQSWCIVAYLDDQNTVTNTHQDLTTKLNRCAYDAMNHYSMAKKTTTNKWALIILEREKINVDHAEYCNTYLYNMPDLMIIFHHCVNMTWNCANCVSIMGQIRKMVVADTFLYCYVPTPTFAVILHNIWMSSRFCRLSE